MTSSQKIDMDRLSLKSVVEALLFAESEPMTVEKMARVVDMPREAVEEALTELREDYQSSDRGLAILFHEGSVELVTKASLGPIVERLLKSKMQESLSKAALEVLSVIAYRGPVSRVDIEAIRGVNCNFTLRNLLLRGLIERKESDDIRGYSYAVSFDFLRQLGLERVEDLLDYGALATDERLETVVSGSGEVASLPKVDSAQSFEKELS